MELCVFRCVASFEATHFLFLEKEQEENIWKKIKCIFCGKDYDATWGSALDNGSPACPECVEKEEKENTDKELNIDMNEHLDQHQKGLDEASENVTTENIGVKDKIVAKTSKLSKKTLIIIAAAAVAVIAIVAALLIPSEFERVKNECVQIAGRVEGSGDYFMIDTYPDEYEDLDATMVALLAPSTQENALEAIKYANEALGFNGSLYSQMMKTTALMGRQSAETDKYKVSWTYHPDDGLEVTYEKK